MNNNKLNHDMPEEKDEGERGRKDGRKGKRGPEQTVKKKYLTHTVLFSPLCLIRKK